MGQGQSGLKREGRRRRLLAEYDPAPLDLPPLRFHETRGENISLFSEGFVAKRVESFCKGIVFSQRPLRLGERVVIRLSGLSSQWTGVLRVGFTNVDPSTLTALPKYACPDLTTKSGFWAKALSSTYAAEASIVQYFVTHNGTVYIGANGEDLGIFFNGVDTKKPLWAMIDLYGNCTTIELVDIRRQFHNNLHNHSRAVTPAALLPQNTAPAEPTAANVQPRTPLPPNLALRHEPPTETTSRPILFHRTKGLNAVLSPPLNIAWRHEDEFAQGYVFSSEPLRPPCKFLLRILGVEPSYIGSLAMGFTNQNPSSLDPNTLPEDSSALVEREGIWRVVKDLMGSVPSPGDELSFQITSEGSVELSINAGALRPILRIDPRSKLWAFWDIYGSTSKIQILGSLSEAPGESIEQFSPEGNQPSGGDCTICYEAPANSVIYTCGHICMCFECAVQQWKGRGGGFCPICRQPIIDVIKTFRS
eukprot:TRINITY_DN3225_c0_g1_i1.p1 TRINITY_DN3225_c0_g1~~TRINITY_DN3225_c0_g1_i1.p1  ORF type:complete len:476 (-),score=146.26 TRINITY_DN3225_c0_g1_i1:279-1706(-)